MQKKWGIHQVISHVSRIRIREIRSIENNDKSNNIKYTIMDIKVITSPMHDRQYRTRKITKYSDKRPNKIRLAPISKRYACQIMEHIILDLDEGEEGRIMKYAMELLHN